MTQLPLSFYNHARDDSDENFIAKFVARGAEVAKLRGILRAQANGGTQHAVIIGARGMGKTLLLRRMGVALASEPELTPHFIALNFREEQYNVRSLEIFWRNVCESFAEWAQSHGRRDLEAALDDFLRIPVGDGPDGAERLFFETCAAIGRRAVLLIDNLDLILDAFADEDNWRLRRALQRPDGPIVIGAATRPLAQSGNREAPFYEFFEPIFLEPLSPNELTQCLRRLAENRPQTSAPVIKILDGEQQRLRTLYTLTGGNPRVLGLLYQVLERADSPNVFSDLEAMLDNVTPFYKARVEEYSGANQRAIIDAVALHWDPIAIAAIARETGLETTTISPVLTRLKRDGFIEENLSFGASANYQIAERLFNIWYLMRHGTRQTRNRVRWLTEFLASFFGEEELRSMLITAKAEKFREDFCVAIEQAIQKFIKPLERTNDLHSLKILSAREKRAVKIFNDSLEFAKQERFEDALTGFDAVIALYGEDFAPFLRVLVARAMFSRGFCLGDLGRGEEAITAYDAVIAKFGDDLEPALREPVAIAMVNKGIILGKLGWSEESISILDAVIVKYSEDLEIALREQVARARVNRSICFSQLGRNEEAIADCDAVIAKFCEDLDPILHEAVARAMINKGDYLGELEHSEEAIATYNAVIAKFGEDLEPALREQVAKAIFNKGVCLMQFGHSEEAIATYNAVIAKYGEDLEPALRMLVAKAMLNMGFFLLELEHSEEAIATYDAVIAKFGDDCEPALRKIVDSAANNKTLVQDRIENEKFWALLENNDLDGAKNLAQIQQASQLKKSNEEIFSAALALGQDNFGQAKIHLDTLLANGAHGALNAYEFLRLLRYGEKLKFGPKLLHWFETSGADKIYAPIYASFVAFIHSAKKLRDVNPETRPLAQQFYDFLTGPKKPEPPAPPRKKRGRPKKKTG